VQIVEAVDYIHDQKIVHRDLKPDNIFVMKNGQIKLEILELLKEFQMSFN
jgi:NIMA (never in mitosis gene a)-related kinase